MSSLFNSVMSMRLSLFSRCLLVLLLAPISLLAQVHLGDSHAQQQLNVAQQWLQGKRYSVVAAIVVDLKDHPDKVVAQKAAEIEVLAAIGMEDSKAISLASDFVKKYPNALGANQIYFKAGGAFFKVGQYSKALPWFQKVTIGGLSTKEQQDYYFYYGYCKFASKDYKAAEDLFSKILVSSDYAKAVVYYKAYMAYASGDYKIAKDLFQSDFSGLKTDRLPYFMADIYFREGNYQSAIQSAIGYLPKANRSEVSQLSKVLGEAYFSLQQYEKAIPYLLDYRGNRRVWRAEDYYQLGYCYYITGQSKEAIAQLNKILSQETDLVQNAYYLLAAAYLKEGQKSQALNAFKRAADLNFNIEIQKEARYNYAQLSYEIGNPYASLQEVFDQFIRAYPKDSRTASLEELLLEASLSEGDFKGALALLAQRNPNDIKARQQIGLQAGLMAIDQKQMTLAQGYFEALIALDTYSEAAVEALFWQSELALRTYAYSNAFDYLAAIKNESLLPDRLRLLLPYQKGYAFFKTKEFTKSITAFKQFISQTQSMTELETERNQAALRIADAYYSSGQFSKAISSYVSVAREQPQAVPYALFNEAMAQGLNGNTAKKIALLVSFSTRFPGHSYLPKVYLELGLSEAAQERNSEAITYFDLLIKEFPNSDLLPQAMLRKGLLQFNLSQADASLKTLQDLVNRFPKSASFSQAVSAAKRIYIDQGRLSDYRKWVGQFNLPQESEASLEKQTYDQLNRTLGSLSQAEQISKFEQYLKDFPNGANALSISYNLALLYTETAQDSKAFPLYDIVAKAQSIDAEAALVAYIKLQLENGLGENPETPLKQLLSRSQDPANKAYALSNLMRLSYEDQSLEAALTYAQEVMALAEVPEEIKQDAQIMLARGANNKGDTQAAIAAYESLRGSASGALVAESLYWLAYYKNASANYEASNELVLELASDYGSFKLWSAKGLLLMGDNFYALEDLFQAQYLWQNVLENFPQYPELIREAETKIAQLEDAKLNDDTDA